MQNIEILCALLFESVIMNTTAQLQVTVRLWRLTNLRALMVLQTSSWNTFDVVLKIVTIELDLLDFYLKANYFGKILFATVQQRRVHWWKLWTIQLVLHVSGACRGLAMSGSGRAEVCWWVRQVLDCLPPTNSNVEQCEKYRHLKYVKASVDKKSFENLN